MNKQKIVVACLSITMYMVAEKNVPETGLLDAIEQGDVEAVKTAIPQDKKQAKLLLNKKYGEDNFTPLQKAALIYKKVGVGNQRSTVRSQAGRDKALEETAKAEYLPTTKSIIDILVANGADIEQLKMFTNKKNGRYDSFYDAEITKIYNTIKKRNKTI